ncbi:hypothetical protein C4566_01810 [Candidatus Parcubacteria bacterium]|nr:MAG: hypothetical protein C4566_01810 [Candidatus Parcubacteria bacterium]
MANTTIKSGPSESAGFAAATQAVEEPDIEDVDDEEEEDEDEENEDVKRRQLEVVKNRSKLYRQKAKQLIDNKLKTQLIARARMRIINIIFGVTGVGLIVTVGNMLFQAIAGNLLRIKGVTKLTGIELGILVGLFLLLLALYILILMVVSLFTDPWSAGLVAIESAIKKLFGILD